MTEWIPIFLSGWAYSFVGMVLAFHLLGEYDGEHSEFFEKDRVEPIAFIVLYMAWPLFLVLIAVGEAWERGRERYVSN